MLLYGLHVEVACHSCGSLSIIACSDALDIWDATKRFRVGAADNREPAVISIGQMNGAQGSSKPSPHLRRTSEEYVQSLQV